MKKTYQHNQVTYGSVGQKWSFQAPNGFEFKTALTGGRDTADKVARIVSGSLSRTKGVSLDNLGRANIRQAMDRAGHKTFVFQANVSAHGQ